MRNDQFAILKGIAIILMVTGHSYANRGLHEFIYLFHMALFYFASGYFFKSHYTDNKLQYIKKKLDGLYFPFIKYSLIFLCLHNFLYKIHIQVKSYLLNDIPLKIIKILLFRTQDSLLGGYWFLYSLFVVSVLFCCIFWIVKKISLKYTEVLLGCAIFLLFIIGSLCNFYGINLPNHLLREIFACTLFYIGFFYKKIEKVILYKWYLTFGAMFFLVLASQYGQIRLDRCQIYNPIFFILVSVAGCYLVMGVASAIIKMGLFIPRFKYFFIYVGEHTIEILTYHFLMFKLVSYLKIKIYHWDIIRLSEHPVIQENNRYWWILYVVVGVICPLIFTFFIDKMKRYFVPVR